MSSLSLLYFCPVLSRWKHPVSKQWPWMCLALAQMGRLIACMSNKEAGKWPETDICDARLNGPSGRTLMKGKWELNDWDYRWSALAIICESLSFDSALTLSSSPKALPCHPGPPPPTLVVGLSGGSNVLLLLCHWICRCVSLPPWPGLVPSCPPQRYYPPISRNGQINCLADK